MKVLYVEDNDDNVFVLKKRLTRVGFTVVIATDGAQGVAMAAGEQPDVILLDWLMPLMDGGEVLNRIAGNGLSSTKIIVISGQPKPEQSPHPRIACWLTKPVTIDELVACIEQPRAEFG